MITTCDNLWKDSSDTIKWFANMSDKNRSIFIKFDIIDFYSSISRDLLVDCINFAKNHMDITDDEINIILTARKSLLASNDSTWIKCQNDNFDVPMGAYD